MDLKSMFDTFGPFMRPNMHSFEGYIRFIMAQPKHKAKIRARQMRDSKRKK